MKLRSSANFQRIYRDLQTLQTFFNFCFRKWFFPTHKCAVMNVAVLGTFGAVKLSGPRAINMLGAATLSLLYLGMFFKKLGNIFVISEDVLRSWYCGAGKNRRLRSFLKSSLPLRSDVGYYYYVTKTTVVVIWATVFNLTTNLLLSV